MPSRARLILSTLVASVLSGGYWLGFLAFAFAYAFTAADYRAGSASSETVLQLKVAAVLVGGPLVFAIGIAVWRGIEAAVVGTSPAGVGDRRA